MQLNSLKDGSILKTNRIDGVIPILKPAGMTSHDVVAKLRRIIGTKRIGHTGTLDPEVTGVLPICIGKATRLSEYIMEQPKIYQGQLTLGKSTTTQDFTGQVIEEKKVKRITESDVQQVFQTFIGEIEQIPPMYSSVKIGGKKLYELARQGKEVDRKPRKVTIYELKIRQIDLSTEFPTIDFQVKCSKGTYVRTLCVDIGIKLGYPAHMSKLVREKSGSFTIEQSFTLEQVENYADLDQLDKIIVSMASSLPQYPSIILSENEIIYKVFNGQQIKVSSLIAYDGLVKVLNQKNDLVAIYQKKSQVLEAKPVKVFKEEEN